MQISPLPHVDMAMEVDSFRSSSKGGRPQKKKRGFKPIQKDRCSFVEKSELISHSQADQPSTPKKSIIRPAKLVHIGIPRTPNFDVSDKEVVVYSPRQDPKLQTLAPVVCLSPLDTFAMSMDDLGDTASVSHTSNKGKGGRSKKIKRGRPKTLKSTRKEQLKTALKRYVSRHHDVMNEIKKRYIENNPDVGRKSVKVYTQKHPDVHRESTRRYDQQYPEEHLVRNRRFRVNNPTDGQVRRP
uniref:Uncharacterized protein n=1 Tax=Cacopsylla melanoneura TaxID=428564 RepID=A0A8D9EXX9_9HEMI